MERSNKINSPRPGAAHCVIFILRVAFQLAARGPDANSIRVPFSPESISSALQRQPNVGLFLSRFRVCEYYSRVELTFKLSDDVKDYIWELTNGQPAAVRAVLDGLSSSEICRPFRKDRKAIPLDVALRFSENDLVLVGTLEGSVHGIKRILPPPTVLRNIEIANFLREMVACRVCRDGPMKNNALNMCYTEGWLHAELTQDGQDVYVFLTTLHRRYLSLCLF